MYLHNRLFYFIRKLCCFQECQWSWRPRASKVIFRNVSIIALKWNLERGRNTMKANEAIRNVNRDMRKENKNSIVVKRILICFNTCIALKHYLVQLLHANKGAVWCVQCMCAHSPIPVSAWCFLLLTHSICLIILTPSLINDESH